MPISKAKRAAVAYHEAGHAVVAWRRDVKFKHVTIVPDDSLGMLFHGQSPKWFRPDIDSSPRINLRAESHIVVSFAGQLAEAKFLGKHPRFGMHSDNRQAVDMAFRLCGSEKTVNAYLRYLWSACEDSVSVYWRDIQAVAAALLEKKTLSYLDVARDGYGWGRGVARGVR